MKVEYDWVVVGSGAAGIAIAEMLSRAGLSVLLVEKNQTLASETTKIFHEWLHTGALYTLVPDRLKTTRYLLGAIDDLLEYYSGNVRMNLAPSDSGLDVRGSGWFNDDRIVYRYRARPLNPVWGLAVARARWLVREIKAHDWLRRRAGSLHDGARFSLPRMLPQYPTRMSGFQDVVSPDVTINSRVLLSDLLTAFSAAGGRVETGVDVERIVDEAGVVTTIAADRRYTSRHVAICCADGLSRFTQAPLKISYAPMFVAGGIPPGTPSFVELDYYVKRCINLITKGNGLGLAAGISVSSRNDVQGYLDYCIKMHRERNPSIEVLGSYVGLKKELVGRGQNRNYLYHIHDLSANVYGVVLGKFTLMFSLAPELFRRVYRRNPPRLSMTAVQEQPPQFPGLSNAEWVDVVQRGGMHRGDD
jgi:hypothetical protein